MNSGEDIKLSNTREKIIEVAIEEFYCKGYDDASMRKIAEKIGIKASSIYNHFKSKEEILEEVFKYYKSFFNNYDLVHNPEQFQFSKEDIPRILKGELHSFIHRILERESINKILKILIKEQFKNHKIREFFLEEFIERPRASMEKFIIELIEKGFIKDIDPHLLSQEFHSFAIYKFYEEFMLKDIDRVNIEKLEAEVNQHIDFFWRNVMNK